MKECNLLIVTNLYPNKKSPALGVFVKNICDGLEGRGWDVNKNILTCTIKNPFGYLSYCVKTWIRVRNYKGIIFVQYVGISALPVILLSLINSNLQIVSNFHGSDGVVSESDNKLVAAIKKNLSRIAIRNSRLTIYPSEYFYMKMLDLYSDLRGRDFLISSSGGVSLSGFLCESSNRQIDFIFAGRMIPGKGVITAIKTIHGAVNSNVETQALFVGEGKEKKLLLEFCQHFKLTKYVKLKSFVHQRELAYLLRSAKVFLFPSTNMSESLGLTLIEAIDAGCIPITMSNGAVDEIIPFGLQNELIAKDEQEFIEKSLAAQKLSFSERKHISLMLTDHIKKFDCENVLNKLSKKLKCYA
ncbi:glycosyltransferase family 4 protein [Microbulbifer sp. TRSA002]|uniref:glycosyltransferase family 4 protein n=1 Tax=Microbulbifer sp. TRSA002 TaxID=3243382 RepID=UPI004039A7C8